MISSIISRLVILVFGTLYPAYASYKAVKTKNVKEYVKWMMYWIVFALFTCTETFTDIFLSWFPFYYEIKIILVIWLLSPATKGSSILYRKFVHPMLSSREQEIDEYISKAKEQSYRQVLDLGQKGVTVLMQTAIKGGGGIVNQLKKSYSLSDLSDPTNDGNDEADDVLVTDPRLMRRRKPGRSPHRSSSASSSSVYFSEVDVVSGGMVGGGRVSEVRSIEDISSGYSSGEGLYSQNPLKLQSRESIASQRTSSLTRARSTRVTRSSVPKKTGGTSDDSDENEVFDTNIIFLNDKMKKIDKLPEKPESSSSETEFFDIPDSNNGFHLHGKTFDNKERTSSNNINTDRNVNTHRKEKNENVKHLQFVKDCSHSSAQPSCSATIGYADDNSKVTACKNDSSLSFNLTKLSTALSSLYPSSAPSTSKSDASDYVESNIVKENASKELDLPSSATRNVELKENSSETANLEINYYKPDILRNVQNVSVNLPTEITNVTKKPNLSDTTKGTSLIELLPESSCSNIEEFTSNSALKGVSGSATSHTNKHTYYLKDELTKSSVNNVTDANSKSSFQGISCPVKAATNKNTTSLSEERLPKPCIDKIINANSKIASEDISDCIVANPGVRGGKYKKKLAPLPPLPPRKENVVANPIKATLVLQPGVVRSLSLSAESLNNKEIFLNYSPKARRRSRNRSPASSSAKSSDLNSSSKMGQALNKMLQLPKKVTHLNIPGRIKEKRNSWGEFFHAKKMEVGKVQSKSASNLDKSPEREESQEIVKTIQRTGSQISVRSLSDSPLAHRRLRIIRRYVDNDID